MIDPEPELRHTGEARREPKQYRLAHVREALAHDPRVSGLDIGVSIAAGKVFLTGVVPTSERQQAMSDIVRELLPDHEVHNETTVGSFPGPEEAERLS